jgi:hypothetical protein
MRSNKTKPNPFRAALVAAFVLPISLASGNSLAQGVLQVGAITHPAIRESSGLVASRRYPGVFWTHNDSGKPHFLFAIRQDGAFIRGFQLFGANPIDWEDLARDNAGNLYLADTGIDGLPRTHVAVHRMPEPNPFRISGVRVNRTWLLRFPDIRHDVEAFFVWNGFGYLVTKVRTNDLVGIYSFPLSAKGRSILLRKVTDVEVTAQVTAADITPDGQKLALLTEEGAYSFRINGDVSQTGGAPRTFTQLINTFMEGACFTTGGLLVSAETRQMLLFTGDPFRSP